MLISGAEKLEKMRDGRHQLYEKFYAGSSIIVRNSCYGSALGHLSRDRRRFARSNRILIDDFGSEKSSVEIIHFGAVLDNVNYLEWQYEAKGLSFNGKTAGQVG